MTDVISPYINTEYYTKVDLMPDQMNNDVYTHLKLNLKKNIEKNTTYGNQNKRTHTTTLCFKVF